MTQLLIKPKDNLNLLKPLIQEVYADLPIVGELCLTQAFHESNLLRYPSQLALKYNNLFGIKGKGLTGKSVMLPTWEEVNGKTVYVKAAFAMNDSVEDSVQQHFNLMQKDRYKIVRESKTREEAFKNILKAGYATDSKYVTRLEETWNAIQRLV